MAGGVGGFPMMQNMGAAGAMPAAGATDAQGITSQQPFVPMTGFMPAMPIIYPNNY